MKIPARHNKGVTILEPKGKITIGVGDVALREAVHEAVDAGAQNILINLGEVTTIDSSGIGELVAAYTTVTNRGGNLKLLIEFLCRHWNHIGNSCETKLSGYRGRLLHLPSGWCLLILVHCDGGVASPSSRIPTTIPLSICVGSGATRSMTAGAVTAGRSLNCTWWSFISTRSALVWTLFTERAHISLELGNVNMDCVQDAILGSHPVFQGVHGKVASVPESLGFNVCVA